MKVKDESILKIRPLAQDSSKEIRYSKKIDFNDKIIMNFNKKINLRSKEFDLSSLKDPYLLKDG